MCFLGQRIFGGAEACPDSLAVQGCSAGNNFFTAFSLS